MQSQTKRSITLILLAAALLLFSNTTYGAKEVRFGSVSWTGVTVKTELGKHILDSLGYEASIKTLSVPIVYQALGQRRCRYLPR